VLPITAFPDAAFALLLPYSQPIFVSGQGTAEESVLIKRQRSE